MSQQPSQPSSQQQPTQQQSQLAQQGQSSVQAMPSELVYRPKPGVMDEAHDASGKVRGHWQYLLDSLKSIGAEAIENRQSKAQRILRDDGATYNIYEEHDASSSRAWNLDLVPALISSEEWGTVEAGLIERSELFDLLLKDIYGPRDLLRTGVIPPEALYCHRSFLRGCHGIEMPGEHQLILHAVDLMRAADGQLHVITDRTQAPSGAGYALENRTVMSRVFPSLYRDSHVHRLATYFHRLRSKLVSLSPHQEQPRIVVLTPGAHNETYFEHAHIANYLGLHLVQSGDLVVRNGFVWMKSLDGLSRVDVILRRVDDWFCDPVELRSDSLLGVANLLEVVRSGNVVIANPLGSGILENPVFLRYLPQISKALIGRELRLPSVNTYWCGNEKDLAFVLANFENLVIKPTQRTAGSLSVKGNQLTAQQKQELIANVKARPYDYVAQDEVASSHLPTFINNQLQSRPSILRTFSLATEQSYTILPGGLTRVGVQDSCFHISNQVGSQSKDTWVIASEPERAAPAPTADEFIAGARDAGLISLPSRVVENLFWMGRYAERAEATLRILRTVFMILNGEDNIGDDVKRILLKTVTEVSATHPGFVEADQAMFDNPEEELIMVLKDPHRLGSVRSNINAMLYCSDQSQELLSSDTLRVTNDIRDALAEMDSAMSIDLASAPEEALDPLVTALMALSGLSQESMIRGIGWRFMEIGRRLERGIQTTSMLKSLLAQEVDESAQQTLLGAALLSLEVIINYRRRYGARMNVPGSLELVLMNTENPRSLLFQLELLTQHISALPVSDLHKSELSEEARAVLEAETAVKLARMSKLNVAKEGTRHNLVKHLDNVKTLLGKASDVISQKYFEHRQTSRQLVSNTWETP